MSFQKNTNQIQWGILFLLFGAFFAGCTGGRDHADKVDFQTSVVAWGTLATAATSDGGVADGSASGDASSLADGSVTATSAPIPIPVTNLAVTHLDWVLSFGDGTMTRRRYSGPGVRLNERGLLRVSVNDAQLRSNDPVTSCMDTCTVTLLGVCANTVLSCSTSSGQPKNLNDISQAFVELTFAWGDFYVTLRSSPIGLQRAIDASTLTWNQHDTLESPFLTTASTPTSAVDASTYDYTSNPQSNSSIIVRTQDQYLADEAALTRSGAVSAH